MADEYINRTLVKAEFAGVHPTALIYALIDRVPAADVVPVIRCERCDNWNEWDHSGHKSLGNFRCSCAYWTVEDGPTFYTAPTDFCSYAEPRDPHEP